jgi:hypothetical protein
VTTTFIVNVLASTLRNHVTNRAGEYVPPKLPFLHWAVAAVEIGVRCNFWVVSLREARVAFAALAPKKVARDPFSCDEALIWPKSNLFDPR